MAKRMNVGLWIALILAAAAGPAHAATLQTVAIQGDASPAGGLYRRFKQPAISDAAGEHVAVFNPTTDFSDKCIFRLDTAGGGSTIACQRATSPDGRIFSKIGEPSINAAGLVAFASRTTFGNDGVFKGLPLSVVALTNDPVGAVFLDDLVFGRITTAGDVVFQAALTGGAAGDAGIFRCSGGDGNCSPNTLPPGTGVLTTLVRVGDAVPDRLGREFCSLTAVQASTFGIAFSATTALDCTSLVEVPAAGVFRRPTAGPVTTIALEGEIAGVGPTTYRGFRGTPVISDTGFVAYQADLAGTPSSALFRCEPVGCPVSPATAVAERGEADGNGNAFNFLSPPGVSDAGDVAFKARTSGGTTGLSSGAYIWRSASSTFDTIALKNDPVPGIPGAIFTVFLLGPPGMSPSGKVVFRARIKRPVAPRNRDGIFVFE